MNETTTKQIADDSRPMTGIWYRSTSDPNVRAKVVAKDFNWVQIVITGGIVAECTIGEFADSWEMI